jgi:hypothetical protein
MRRLLIIALAGLSVMAAPASAFAKGFDAEHYAKAYTYKYEDVRGYSTDCWKTARRTWRCNVEGEDNAHTGVGYGDRVKLAVKIKHKYHGWYWYGWTLSFRYI